MQESKFLLHAVLALSCHHTDLEGPAIEARKASGPVLEHGQVALKLLRQNLRTDVIAQASSSLLDTIIVLFSLDVRYYLIQLHSHVSHV